jgi:beta-barrel assembly-enhancing protease
MRYCFLVLIYIICLPIAAIELPDIGMSANTVMSPADERKLGEAFLRQIRREVNVIDELQISHYFNALGHRLASYSNAPAQHFYFFALEKTSLNAFAVPGGFIGIHSGLILKTRSESELASVLAHEIAHVTQRHIARTIEASQRFSLPTIAAIIAAAILAGASNSPQVGEAALAAVMAGNVQMQINFTRTHEKEADRLGMQILAKAGFEPRDMANVFERFYAGSRFYQSTPEFLRTHPVTTDRIAEARLRAKQYERQPLSDTPLYHLMKAKLLVLVTDDKPKLLKRLKNMLKTGRYRDERATRYALALTLLETKQTHGVQTQIDWLLKNDSDRVIYRLLQAQLKLLQKNDQKAMQIYEQALQIYPGDKMLGLDYAEKLLQNNAPKKAKTVLFGLKDSNNPYYHRLLARAYQETGEKAQAHLALAENYYLIGYTRLAVEQLELARQTDKIDFYLASRIDARLGEMQQELLELHKASRDR